MRLPIRPDQAVGPDEDGGVSQAVAVAFEQAAHGVDVEPPAGLRQGLRGRAAGLLGVGHRLFEAVEHVPRDVALGEDEEIYARRNGSLELVEQRALEPGDFYELIPPQDDIHRVRTTSAETSVSIHLLTNDTGCVWRHAYDPDSGEERPFRSGYVNVACQEDA